MDLDALLPEDYTNQENRAFFDIGSSNNSTSRTLLEYYFSDVVVSFFQMCSPTERYQIDLPKRSVGSPEILISLHTQFVVAPPWTRLAFTTETAHDTTLASSESLELQSLSPLYAWNKHARFTSIRYFTRCTHAHQVPHAEHVESLKWRSSKRWQDNAMLSSTSFTGQRAK